MPNGNELEPTVKMSNFIKKVGIQGTRATAKTALAEVKPETVPNRYAIGFDDSGSMSGQPFNDAKKAVAGFLAACSPLETSVAVYPYSHEPKPLSNMFNVVTAYVNGISLGGSTPLWANLKQLLSCNLTRGIIFSDGGPTDAETDEISIARDKRIPVDTVYIGMGDSPVLRRIAESTGGIYLRFDNTTSFAKNLKYLSPKYVALLANSELKERIQRGETI